MPGWAWVAKDRQGRRASGWHSGSLLVNEESLIDLLKRTLHNLDFSEVKCERRDQEPVIVRKIPPEWFMFGTTEFSMEVAAGVREQSIYVPPDLLEKRIKGKETPNTPLQSTGLKPSWRR